MFECYVCAKTTGFGGVPVKKALNMTKCHQTVHQLNRFFKFVLQKENSYGRQIKILHIAARSLLVTLIQF